jgi:tetratricopeptide (TPR) repeat protein
VHAEILFVLSLILSRPFAVAVHEGGHALAAWLVGWRVQRIVIGSGAGRVFRVGAIEVEIGRLWGGGLTWCWPETREGYRWRAVAIYAGGAIANGIVAYAAGRLAAAVGRPFGIVILAFAVMNAFGLRNLVPRTYGSGRSNDGMLIWRVVSASPRRAAAMASDNIHFGLARQMALGDLVAAAAAARRVAARAPEDVGANGILGLVALREERWSDAELPLRRALRVPEWKRARIPRWYLENALAWALLRKGSPKDLEEALRRAEDALGAQPDNPAILDTCGEARVRSGQVEEGMALLERACVARSLALGWELRGESEKAEQFRAIARNLDAR